MTVSSPENVRFILEKWVPALRSGEYVQGRGTLKSPDGEYCCLGVACDLMSKEGLLPDWERPGGYGAYFIAGAMKILPVQAQVFLGMGAMGVWLDEHGDRPNLVTLNDDYDWDFLQIADALEHHYTSLYEESLKEETE